MPYQNNEALPDNIKNSLPQEAQNIWRDAFNSAYAQNKGDEEKCNKQAWGAVTNAGYQKNEKGEWAKKEKFTSYNLENIEIFSEGEWKGDTYNHTDLEEIVNNFELLKDEIKPNIHIGHDRGLEHDGQPALGWITKLTIKGIKLLADLNDVPEIVYNAIKKKLYSRVSSEILWGVKHTKSNKRYGKVLTGVAIIGASNNIPAVRTLQDLAVFTDITYTKVYDFNIKEGIIHDIGGDKMSEELKQYKEDLENANKKAELAAQEAKEYKEKLEKMEAQKLEDSKNRETENIKKYCEDQIKAGKLAPAASEIILQDIDKKIYTEDNKFSFSFSQIKDILEKQYTIDMNEQTRYTNNEDKADNIDDVINKKVNEHMKSQKMTYTEAMKDLLATNQEFAKMYTDKYENDKQ